MGLDLLLRSIPSKSRDPESDRTAPLLFLATGDASYRRAYYESAASSVLMLEARDEVAAALAAEGIRPVAFKGADLADSLYPSSALRPMSDVDFLVRSEEVIPAEECLARLGFEPFYPEVVLGLTRRTKHARLFVRDRAAIDLHWSLVRRGTPLRAPDLDWFRARTVDDGAPFLRFDATAHLLYLVAHARLQHDNEQPPLLALVDFYLLSHSGRVRWDAFVAEARRLGWIPALDAHVREVSARLGLPLPNALTEALGPMDEEANRHDMAEPLEGPARVFGEWSSLGIAARAAFVGGHLFPRPTYMKRRYHPRHPWTWPLYYLVRWGRILRDALSLAARRLVAG